MKSLIEEARGLATAHRKADPETKIIKFFPTASPDEVCLLEVSTAVSTCGEILPFGFPSAPEHGVEHPSTVILLSPEEWEQVREGELALPSGWDLQNAEDV